MKNKIIVMTSSIIVVVLLFGILLINNYSDNEYITLDDGTTLAVVIDEESSSTLPTNGGYKADITCDNADGVWKYNTDNSQWEIELSNIAGTVSCNATFTSLTDDDLAANYIQNLLGDSTTVESGTNAYLVNEGLSSSSDVGIRYEGANPDNYVWFNNEMWRIIGVIPTKTSSGTENLVKIIRNDDIGSYAYDGKSSSYTGVWGSNTLYTLLNSYYWGASDGTGTSYCKGHSTYASPNCDYTNIGISSSSYYGSMVQYVYWNTGASTYSATPSTVYANEIATQTVGGYIGIMNASDYGYANYYIVSHSSVLSTGSTSGLYWLFKTGTTWTMTVYTTSSQVNYIRTFDDVGSSDANDGYSVRPALYLKSADVYIIDGTGSESDPYILGTN